MLLEAYPEGNDANGIGQCPWCTAWVFYSKHATVHMLGPQLMLEVDPVGQGRYAMTKDGYWIGVGRKGGKYRLHNCKTTQYERRTKMGATSAKERLEELAHEAGMAVWEYCDQQELELCEEHDAICDRELGCSDCLEQYGYPWGLPESAIIGSQS